MSAARDVAAVAADLGLTVRRGSISPCPSCGSRTRESRGSRGPIRIFGHGTRWHCFRCKSSGDAANLVAWVKFGDGNTRGRRWHEIQRVLAASGSERYSPDHIPTDLGQLPPMQEIARLWSTSLPVSSDTSVAQWLRGRRLDAGVVQARDLARSLPEGAQPRWAGGDARDGTRWTWHGRGFRVLLPLYDVRGAMRSLKARSIHDGAR